MVLNTDPFLPNFGDSFENAVGDGDVFAMEAEIPKSANESFDTIKTKEVRTQLPKSPI